MNLGPQPNGSRRTSQVYFKDGDRPVSEERVLTRQQPPHMCIANSRPSHHPLGPPQSRSQDELPRSALNPRIVRRTTPRPVSCLSIAPFLARP